MELRMSITNPLAATRADHWQRGLRALSTQHRNISTGIEDFFSVKLGFFQFLLHLPQGLVMIRLGRN